MNRRLSRLVRTVLGRALLAAALIVMPAAPALSAASTPTPAPEPVARPQLMSVFLYNFLYFTTWPPEKDPSALHEPFTIGVVGDSPIPKALRGLETSLAAAGKMGIRVLTFGTYHAGQDYKDCHILFVSAEEHDHFAAIIKALDRAPVLTVSEDDDFLAAGGMITFVEHGNRLRFRINRAAVAATRLRLSSQLLNSALSTDR